MAKLEIMSPQRFYIPGGTENGRDLKRTIDLKQYTKAGVHYRIEFLTNSDKEQFFGFFEDVKKLNKISMGMFQLRFLDSDIWARTTFVTQDTENELIANFVDHGNGEKILGLFEEI